ncbi:hypothetical protein Tco_0190476 [Tanacetum coccineum]
MEQQESIEIMKVKKFSSSDEFISQIEPRNIPDVSFHKWNPPTAGLDYFHKSMSLACLAHSGLISLVQYLL